MSIRIKLKGGEEKELIIGSVYFPFDWRNTDCKSRGEMLLEYIAATNFDLLNRGREPTFRSMIREEVIDISLMSMGAWELIKGVEGLK